MACPGADALRYFLLVHHLLVNLFFLFVVSAPRHLAQKLMIGTRSEIENIVTSQQCHSLRDDLNTVRSKLVYVLFVPSKRLLAKGIQENYYEGASTLSTSLPTPHVIRVPSLTLALRPPEGVANN